jgi:hypothetical protein
LHKDQPAHLVIADQGFNSFLVKVLAAAVGRNHKQLADPLFLAQRTVYAVYPFGLCARCR